MLCKISITYFLILLANVFFYFHTFPEKKTLSILKTDLNPGFSFPLLFWQRVRAELICFYHPHLKPSPPSCLERIFFKNSIRDRASIKKVILHQKKQISMLRRLLLKQTVKGFYGPYLWDTEMHRILYL